jgi:S1-C subfamily serine protease
LRRGDVIVAVAGRPVPTPAAVVQAVEASGVGNPLTLTLLRNGQQISLAVVPTDLRVSGGP